MIHARWADAAIKAVLGDTVKQRTLEAILIDFQKTAEQIKAMTQ